jgi:hypothetical protein
MRPTTRQALRRVPALPLVAALALAALSGCSGEASKAAAKPSQTPTSSAGSRSPSLSSSPTAAPTPERPSAPAFAPGDKGQKAFAAYVVDTWGYALATNDAAALTRLSPSKKELCRGCSDFAAELRRRDKQGWHVEFPGASVRRTTLQREGERILATTVADIPPSQSFFDDGTFRNDNEAHRGARFLIDLRTDGQAKKQHYVLLAFSLR